MGNDQKCGQLSHRRALRRQAGIDCMQEWHWAQCNLVCFGTHGLDWRLARVCLRSLGCNQERGPICLPYVKRRGTSRFVPPEQSPLEWLESKHGEMAAIAESLASKMGSDRFQLNGVLPPSRFRDLVKSLGFQELEQAGAFLVFNGTG